jgi:hypothetical protein
MKELYKIYLKDSKKSFIATGNTTHYDGNKILPQPFALSIVKYDGESGKKPIKINIDRDDEDWFFINATENELKGSCGAENLEELLEYVVKWLTD